MPGTTDPCELLKRDPEGLQLAFPLHLLFAARMVSKLWYETFQATFLDKVADSFTVILVLGKKFTKQGRMGLLDMLVETPRIRDKISWNFSLQLVKHAAHHNNIEAIRYFESKGIRISMIRTKAHPFGKRDPVGELMDVAKLGHIDCLEYFVDARRSYDDRWTLKAAEGGQIESMRYLHEKGVKWHDDVCSTAASLGFLDCLAYACEHGAPITNSFTQAAQKGRFNCMRYLHENGHAWNEHIGDGAASSGNLDCLKFAVETGHPPDMQDICQRAADSGSIECVDYARSIGGLWDPSIFTLDFCSVKECLVHLRNLGWTWTKAGTKRLIETKNLDCLMYAHQNGAPLCENPMVRAALFDNVEAMRYLHEAGVPWDKSTVATCYRSSAKKCLVYSVSNGSPYNYDGILFDTDYWSIEIVEAWKKNNGSYPDFLCTAAAKTGRLELLRYAHAKGCRMNEATTTWAALHGALDCLVYAHRHGCPFETRAVEEAVVRRRRPCLRYLLEHGCPMNEALLKRAIKVLGFQPTPSREFCAGCSLESTPKPSRLAPDSSLGPNKERRTTRESVKSVN